MFKYIIYHHNNKIYESISYETQEEAVKNGYEHLDAKERIDEKYYTISFNEVFE